MSTPRAYTAAEIRAKMLRTMQATISEWARYPNKTIEERLAGAAFSFLAMLDGAVPFLPGMQLIPRPHPSDKQYHIDHGENWYPDDVDIADGVELHEEWCDMKKTAP